MTYGYESTIVYNNKLSKTEVKDICEEIGNEENTECKVLDDGMTIVFTFTKTDIDENPNMTYKEFKEYYESTGATCK